LKKPEKTLKRNSSGRSPVSSFKDALVNAVRDAKSLSENRSDETVKEARSKAEKIEKIRNDLLRSIVMKHISRILPEGED
jgi:hypothetical protein